MARIQGKPPTRHSKSKKLYPGLFAAWDASGKAVRDEGPIDAKTGHPI